MAESNTHDFFTESRKLKGRNINLFGKKYDELYNSESYNESDMENLSECVKASICNQVCNLIYLCNSVFMRNAMFLMRV